jgi:hypothetical protein
MAIEISRLVMGLLVLCFHKQIADYILVRERELAELLQTRGNIRIPVPSQAAFQNLYFCLGMAVALLSMVNLWTGNV